MSERIIFERMRSGELILESDPDYPAVYEAILRAQRLTAKLNTSVLDPGEARALLGELMGAELDPTTWILPPFYTDFGQFTRFGSRAFVNSGCMFMDRGGITVEDEVFIGPGVHIITENHPEDPALRHNVYTRPILIRRNAWIGARAVILPGVIVGENAIVGAGAVVTRDVEDNTIVAGNPARVIRKI